MKRTKVRPRCRICNTVIGYPSGDPRFPAACVDCVSAYQFALVLRGAGDAAVRGFEARMFEARMKGRE